MAPKYDYKCTECGNKPGRENLCVKRVSFNEIGRNGKRLKTRTVAWLCEDCRNIDPAWRAEKHHESPGMDRSKVELIPQGEARTEDLLHRAGWYTEDEWREQQKGGAHDGAG